MKVHEDLTVLYLHHPLSSVYQDRKKRYTRSRDTRKAGLAGESKQKFREAKCSFAHWILGRVKSIGKG